MESEAYRGVDVVTEAVDAVKRGRPLDIVEDMLKGEIAARGGTLDAGTTRMIALTLRDPWRQFIHPFKFRREMRDAARLQ